MSLEGLLNSTCSISRFTASGVDAHGQPTGTWADLATRVKVRFQEMVFQNQFGAEMTTPDGVHVTATHKAWMRYDQGITEMDKLTTVVVDGDSSRYSGLSFDVCYVAAAPGGRGNHHKELWLRVVR